ncbi:MAG TPA: hypothetical protein VKZ53_09275 [Candidatus Angelobacter sp.]|nr:hypothetical protein [Candidatus Angelobacter sp.]
MAATEAMEEAAIHPRFKRFVPASVLLSAWWVLIAALIAWAIQTRRADLLDQNGDEASLRKASRIEPLNAEHVHTLGRYALFQGQDADEAISNYRRAVTLNPHISRYWLDLAGAYQVKGDVALQQSAVERALAAYPTNPDVAWEAANFSILSGDVTKALQHFRTVMTHDPASTDRALELCWKVSGDVDAILSEAVPSDAGSYFQFLDFLTDRDEPEAAQRVWLRLQELKQSAPAQLALPYIQFLMDRGSISEAWGAWKQLAQLDPAFGHRMTPENLMVNGGFDDQILNGGFDWRVQPKPAARLALDEFTFHSGRRSLLIAFNGLPVDDVGIEQRMAVQPHTDYELSAFVRAEDIESRSGPRLAITNAEGALLAWTDDSLGTVNWQQESLRVNSGNARLLYFRVLRQAGDSPIKGRFWIDDLQLVAR